VSGWRFGRLPETRVPSLSVLLDCDIEGLGHSSITEFMKRIFIISPHPLFSQGVEALLGKETAFRFVGRDTDADWAIESIRQVCPDVVILDCETPVFDQTAVIVRLLKERPGIIVIGLNLQDNTVRVYGTAECVVRGVNDLVNAIATEFVETIPNQLAQEQKGG